MTVGETSFDKKDLGKRDEVHSPCVVVFCEETIEPGSSVRFVSGSTTQVCACGLQERQGVADPFITSLIFPGFEFLMFLEPSIVGGLVHHFEIEGVTTTEPVAEPSAKTLEQLEEQLAAAEERVEELEEKIRDHDDYDDGSGCRGC